MNWSENGSKPNELDRLLDGFYIADRWSYQNGAGRWLANPSGKDMPEFSIDASVMAGLEANLGFIRGRVEGGVTGHIGLDFVDQGELSGKSDGKLRSYEIKEMFSDDPSKWLSLQGGLYAALNAAVQIGFDAGLISQWHDIWTQELLRIAIFEFSSQDRSSQGVHNDPMSGATIFFDGDLDARPDLSEPSTESSPSSTYMFSVENKIFDKNKNDKIDFEEGRLIAYGGKDLKTGIHQQIPFVASFGENINPISTLVRLASESGHDEDKVISKVMMMFGLKDHAYQHTDPIRYLDPLQKSSATHSLDKANEYLAHVKIHYVLDSISGIVRHVLPDITDDTLTGKLEVLTLLSDQIVSNYDKDTDGNDVLLKTYDPESVSYTHLTLPTKA